MTKEKNSRDLWLSIVESVPEQRFELGKQTTDSYYRDPKHLVFVVSRYKFVAKMVAGTASVLEVGCGDSFGAPIVAAEVEHLICTDIDNDTLADNQRRYASFPKLTFQYHDFRDKAFDQAMDAIYAVDVIEHIYKEEEALLLSNVTRSLSPRGFALFGTPNKTAEQYASVLSRKGHVNVKTQADLRQTCSLYFNNVFMFGMNDEVLHTGFSSMCHYIWALCVGPKGQS